MKLSAKYLTMAICTVLATLMVAPEGTSIWGTPSANAQTVVSEAVQKDTTWTREGSPYIISADIRVKGTDGDDGVTTLTIQAGAVIKFDRYRSLVVGTSEDEPGALSAKGELDLPISLHLQ